MAQSAACWRWVSSTLQDPQQWYEVMILHLNTKYCRATTSPLGMLVNLNIGSKTPQTLAQSTRVTLTYTVTA